MNTIRTTRVSAAAAIALLLFGPARGQASYTFPSVLEPVTFYVRGGDDRTDTVKLNIIERRSSPARLRCPARPPDVPQQRAKSSCSRSREPQDKKRVAGRSPP